MALKLYGVTSNWGVDFMIRAQDDGASTLALLEKQLTDVPNVLGVEDFESPIRLTGTLVAEGFLINGPVNGAAT